MGPTNSNPFNPSSQSSNSQEPDKTRQRPQSRNFPTRRPYIEGKLNDAVNFLFGKWQEISNYFSSDDSPDIEMKDAQSRKRKADHLEGEDKTGHIASRTLRREPIFKRSRIESTEEGESEFGVYTEYHTEETELSTGDHNWEQEIYRAIDEKDDDRVQKIMKGHHINNEILSEICHANLIGAAERGISAVLMSREGFFESLLLEMCQEGHIEIAEILLKRKVYPIVKSDQGETALHIACQKGYTKLISLMVMLKPEINLDFPTQRRLTPLQIACNSRHKDIVELLIGSGRVDINFSTMGDPSPIEIAVQKRDIDILKLLLANERIKVNITDRTGNTLLHQVLKRGFDEHIVRILLESGKIDINAENGSALI